MPSAPVLVDTPAALAALAAAAAEAPVLGVDTEFHAEGRRRPALMLVQIALPDGRAYVVDPLALPAAAVGAVLDRRPWAAFAGANDQSVLAAALGAQPARVDDAQLLAGLCGYAFPLGLADLAEVVLGERPEKAAALSDWSRRPLLPAQLAYAAEDARLALALWQRLAATAPAERVAWARAEAVAPPPGGAADADTWWRSLAIGPRLDRPTRQALHHLSAWRDAAADARNKPPPSIVSDATLLDLARRRPGSVAAALENRRLSQGLARRDLEALVEVLLTAEQDASAPPSVFAASARPRALLYELAALAAAPHLGIAPALLLPRSWNDAIARGHSLDGWRAAVFGDVVDEISRGTLAIAMSGDGPAFVSPGGGPLDAEKIFRRSAFPSLRVRAVP